MSERVWQINDLPGKRGGGPRKPPENTKPTSCQPD